MFSLNVGKIDLIKKALDLSSHAISLSPKKEYGYIAQAIIYEGLGKRPAALKVLKRKVKDSNLFIDLREREYYTKPSEKKRHKHNLAKLRNNFITGIVVLIPIGITLYLTLFIILQFLV